MGRYSKVAIVRATFTPQLARQKAPSSGAHTDSGPAGTRRPQLTFRACVAAAAAALLLAACSSTAASTGAPPTTDTSTATSTANLVAVPAVAGDSVAQAKAALSAAHLRVGHLTRHRSNVRPGTILAESPTAGSEEAAGTTVNLVVAIAVPRSRVPYVVGESRANATARLEAAGFTVATVWRNVSSGSNRTVLSQSPYAGTQAEAGTRVTIVVANFVAPPPPPAAPPQTQACTTTASGNCIQGGEFCRQDEYGTYGYDANGRKYLCTGDAVHPHWETP